MKKSRYLPDLALMMAECEANYARLTKLMPDMSDQCQRRIGVSLKKHNVEIQFAVVECFKYTATLRVSISFCASQWLQGSDFLVRIYHDAQMAEVVENYSKRQLKGRYRYPNHKMYQSDEKVQANLYLGEWLKHCMLYGHELADHNFADVS